MKGGLMPQSQRWTKPPTRIIKLNWDVALDRKNNKMRVGAIVRDSSGEVLTALSTIVPFINDYDVVEVVVAWKAVTFCCEMGFQWMIFEGDFLNVVNALRHA
jgi:hypothetical protein